MTKSEELVERLERAIREEWSSGIDVYSQHIALEMRTAYIEMVASALRMEKTIHKLTK
jgi:hypothetical protein